MKIRQARKLLKPLRLSEYIEWGYVAEFGERKATDVTTRATTVRRAINADMKRYRRDRKYHGGHHEAAPSP